jgi:predicted PurR-regulated permease PerM
MEENAQDQRRWIEPILTLVALGIVAIGCFIIVRPFISALLWAIVITYSTSAIYNRLLGWLNGRRSLAAMLMTLGVGALIVLPLVLVSLSLTDGVGRLAGEARGVMDRGIGPAPAWVGDLPLMGPHLRDYWATLAAGETNLAETITPYASVAGGWVLGALASVGSGILELLFSLLIAFFLYRDGVAAAASLDAAAARVGGQQAAHALEVAGGTIRGVVYGIVGTNLAQGVLSAAGFWAAGVPGAFLLGFLCFFLTMIPFGPTIIWLPASLFVYYQGSTGAAIALAIWCFLIFYLLENILRPYLISRGSSLPILLILLGMLGGLAAFGLLGIFVGPTILAIGHALINDWMEPARTETGERATHWSNASNPQADEATSNAPRRSLPQKSAN